MKRLIVAFVFLLGMVAGALISRLTPALWRPSPPRPEEIAARMARDLSLDGAQHDKLLELFQAYDPKMRALQKETQERFNALKKEIDGHIEEILTPDQKIKFAALRAKWESHHGPGFGPMPPPRP